MFWPHVSCSWALSRPDLSTKTLSQPRRLTSPAAIVILWKRKSNQSSEKTPTCRRSQWRVNVRHKAYLFCLCWLVCKKDQVEAWSGLVLLRNTHLKRGWSQLDQALTHWGYQIDLNLYFMALSYIMLLSKQTRQHEWEQLRASKQTSLFTFPCLPLVYIHLCLSPRLRDPWPLPICQNSEIMACFQRRRTLKQVTG